MNALKEKTTEGVMEEQIGRQNTDKTQSGFILAMGGKRSVGGDWFTESRGRNVTVV